MIQTIKNLYSKLVNKSPTSEEHNDDTPESVAYCYLHITPENDLVIDGDFLDPEAMSKMIFLLSSGALSDYIIEVARNGCRGDEELLDKIMKKAYELVLQYMAKKHNEESEEESDDNDPVIDPCDVFNFRKTEDVNELEE